MLPLPASGDGTRSRSAGNCGDWQIIDAGTGTILAVPRFELRTAVAAAWLAGYAQERRQFHAAARMRMLAAEPVQASGNWLRGYPSG